MTGPKPFRKQRIESELVREASRLILHELKDPRLGFVTVTKAKVSDDHRYAKIFVSVLGESGSKRLSMQALDHAHGFLQRELGRRIRVRNFPEITFVLDESIEKTIRLSKTLDDLARDRIARGVDPPPEEEE